MKSLFPALWAEILKIRRSIMFWITIIVSLFIIVMMGFLMFVLKYPEYARKYRLVAAKASFIGKADWPSYLGMLTMAMATGGMVGFGFVTSWIFGREYADRTIKDLLSLPTSRSSIVLSKFISLGIWCFLLSILIFFLGIPTGFVLDLADWTFEAFQRGVITYTATCLSTILLCTPVAFFASFGRGFLPPLGFVVLTMILAQVILVLGYGHYFPWAIPALLSGAAGSESAQLLNGMSYIFFFLTSAAGLFATFAWWRFADQT
jgi:ABC-2 type transport system permease protein